MGNLSGHYASLLLIFLAHILSFSFQINYLILQNFCYMFAVTCVELHAEKITGPPLTTTFVVGLLAGVLASLSADKHEKKW